MFTRIEQKSKVFLEVLDQMKRQISSGVLGAGDQLPSERELSGQLGVSRSAVREAIRAFEILGIVRCVQGGGNYLSSDLRNCLVEPMSFMFVLGGGSVEQVQQFRHALELETAHLAADNCTPDDARRLEDVLYRLDSVSDERKRADLDQELHYLIAEIAGNPMIVNTLNAVSNLIESIITGIRVSIINDPREILHIDEQHKAIVRAIASRNSQEAVSCMDQHLQLILRYIVNNTQK